MKTKRKTVGILLLFFCVFSWASCIDSDEEERKITEHKEYVLVIASQKVPGMAYLGCGHSALTDVYAVKREGSQQWEQFPSIGGFEYESGYEYTVRISETSYLDYRMGEPAWTEYTLLEVLSKTGKVSEGLPEDFLAR